MTSQNNSFPIRLDFNGFNNPATIGSLEDFEVWVTKESNAWDWIVGPDLGGLNSKRQELRKLLARSLERIKGGQSLSEHTSNIAFHINKQGYVLSEGTAAEFVKALKEERGAVFATIILQMLHGIYPPTDVTGFEAGVLVSLWKNGIEGSAKAEQVAFRKIKDEAEAIVSDLVSQSGEAGKKFAEFAASASGHLQTAESSTEKFLQICRTRWSELEQHFKEELGLRAPSWYWRDKATSHRRYALIMGLVTGGVTTVTLILLVFAANWALADIRLTDPKLFPVSVFIVALTFTIWVVRIFLRIFLSQLHLAGEAAERRVMILTYLTLLDKGLQHEDRKIILESLFRPSSDGIVKDDGAPASLFEMLSRNR